MSAAKDNDRDDAYYTGILRQLAQFVGWDRLRKLVEKLAAEDEGKKR